MERKTTYIELLNRVAFKKRKAVRIIENDFSVHTDFLQIKIGYRFKDITLLLHALMHKSATSPEADPTGLSSNERLECLGDSVLDFLVVEELFNRRPFLTEGDITKIKSLIVSRKIIGQIAEKIDLENALIFGKSYVNVNSLHTDVASNAFEALIAAIYLDGGMEQAKQILRRFLFPFIDELTHEKENINYKSLILEYVQGEGYPPAIYTVLKESGPDHKKQFTIGIEINGKKMGQAEGCNKKDAEQKAAEKAAEKLGLI